METARLDNHEVSVGSTTANVPISMCAHAHIETKYREAQSVDAHFLAKRNDRGRSSTRGRQQRQRLQKFHQQRREVFGRSMRDEMPPQPKGFWDLATRDSTAHETNQVNVSHGQRPFEDNKQQHRPDIANPSHSRRGFSTDHQHSKPFRYRGRRCFRRPYNKTENSHQRAELVARNDLGEGSIGDTIQLDMTQSLSLTNKPLLHESGSAAKLPAPQPDSPRISHDIHRINLLFGQVERVIIPQMQSTNPDQLVDIEDVNTYSIQLSIRPTDPDFNHEILPDGLVVQLHFFYINNSSEQKSPCSATIEPTLRSSIQRSASDQATASDQLSDKTVHPLESQITILNEGMPSLIWTSIRSVYHKVFRESKSAYNALKMVEQSIPTIFEFMQKEEPTTYAEYCRRFGPIDWTSEEQKRLEDAIIWYGKLAAPKERWSRISAFVGSGRTPRECAERFIECRQALLKKKQEAASEDAEELKSESASESDDEHSGQPKASATVEHNTNNRFSGKRTLEMEKLELKNINLLQFSNLRLLVACNRCRNPIEISASNPLPRYDDNENRSTDMRLMASPLLNLTRRCEKCNSMVHLNIKGQLAFPSSSIIASFDCIGATLADVLPSSYLVECGECNLLLLVKEIMNASEKKSICRKCHSQLSILFQAITLDGTHLGGLEKHQLHPKKVKETTTLQLKLGSPLPDNGTCKHYKKSFRWLRFPCCKRAFPCDICHDSTMDHSAEWANRMICGFCSKEQCYSQKPCSCGASMTASHSSHWEGGKGCRDPTKMSRKDDKKFKMLKKLSKAAQPKK